MSRTTVLLTSYVQAFLFAMLGIRAFLLWSERRDRTSGIMALATGLFGLSQLISAMRNTIWDANIGEEPPLALTVVSSIMTYMAVYAFMLFLAEFIKLPTKVFVAFNAVVILASLFFIVLAVIERPDFKIINFRFVPRQVDNPIAYSTYLGIVLGYLAVAFGILWVAFLVYGLRIEGLARFRMLSIAAGFFVLFVAIGLIPRIVFGKPTTDTIRTTFTIVRYLALATAPLLFLGFTPPDWVTRRFGTRATGAVQASPSPPTT